MRQIVLPVWLSLLLIINACAPRTESGAQGTPTAARPDGNAPAAAPAPGQEVMDEGVKAVAALTAQYQAECHTHEWEIPFFSGKRQWEFLAQQVARKYPEAVRTAVRDGSPIAGEWELVLGDIGGHDNIVFLSELCDKQPTWDLVHALRNTGDKEAFPALRKAMAANIGSGVSYQAADALVRAGDPEVIPAVEAWILSAENRLAGIALAALAADTRLAAPLLKIDPELKGGNRDSLYHALVSCGNDKYLDEIHKQARDESEYLDESQMESPDPAVDIPICNYRQNWALDALGHLLSPKSLSTLDDLALNAKDPNIRERAANIAATIRKKAEAPPSDSGTQP